MTNADKYLKEGVDIAKLAREIVELNYSNDICLEDNITLYFRQEVKPTLTEDERVILRNIDKIKFKNIGRTTSGLLCLSDNNSDYKNLSISNLYDHLFQFIKERRRILYKRIIRRVKIWIKKKKGFVILFL